MNMTAAIDNDLDRLLFAMQNVLVGHVGAGCLNQFGLEFGND